MYHNKIVRKIFLPAGSSSLLAAAVISKSESNEEKEKTLIRPKDLSLYKKPAEQTKSDESESKEESALTSVVRQARQAVWSVSDQLIQVTDQFNHVLDTGKAHTSTAIQTLRDEENYAQRFGAITAGGLVGLLMALRRGWIRRILYTYAGAGAVATVCYPEEAREYGAEALQEAKRFIVIAYHFVNGGPHKKQGRNGSPAGEDTAKPEPVSHTVNDPSSYTSNQFMAEKDGQFSTFL